MLDETIYSTYGKGLLEPLGTICLLLLSALKQRLGNRWQLVLRRLGWWDHFGRDFAAIINGTYFKCIN